MHTEQRSRARELLEERGISHALFASRASVTWLSGFAPPPQLGGNAFAGGPPVVWYDEGEFTLIVLDAFAADTEAFGRQPGCAVKTYLGYTIEQPIASADGLIAVLRETVGRVTGARGAVGVETRDAPVALVQALQAGQPSGATFTPIDGWLDPLRRVKTGEELDKLNAAFRLIEIGHVAARQAVQAGRREIDVWADIHSAVQRAAGQRVPLGNDCTVGYRQANVGGWPLAFEIRPGDSFIVDLSVILAGYWSDSCGTYYAGEPTPKQVAMHRAVEEALQLGVSLVRPGAVARDIDRQVREFLTSQGYPGYPHHTGHGVGVTPHEAPRIVPYNDQVIEAGMVLMLEPGIYYPGETGVRVEDAVLVTPTGAQVLTRHLRQG